MGTALIASVASLGWRPRCLDLWEDHEGRELRITQATFPDLLGQVIKRVKQLIWQGASKHHCGQGLEAAPPADASFRLLRKLQVNERYAEAGLLECVMAGGLWLPARIASCEGVQDPGGPLCGALGCDEHHMLWTCPRLREMESPEVQATQH